MGDNAMDNAREPGPEELTDENLRAKIQTGLRFEAVMAQVETDPEVKLLALLRDDADMVAVARTLCTPVEDQQRNLLAELVLSRVISKVIGPACPNANSPEWATCRCQLYLDRTLPTRDVNVIWANPMFIVQFA